MNNASFDEINKFNESSWWNPNGAFKTLHDINPTRFEFLNEYTQFKDLDFLDVGCGGGIISEGLAKRGANVTAIDLAENALKIAADHAKEENLSIDYQLTTVEAFADLYPNRFDAITCLEMLEHVPDPQSVIKACYTLLKPGGKLFISTINRTFKAKHLVIYTAENLLKIIPKGTHDYNKFITPYELSAFCESANFKVISTRGMQYNPFTRIAYLNNDVSMNYIMYLEKQS